MHMHVGISTETKTNLHIQVVESRFYKLVLVALTRVQYVLVNKYVFRGFCALKSNNFVQYFT
jgi:hypothetical protein